jgi:tetratricopeptide (TPR) repeat protein
VVAVYQRDYVAATRYFEEGLALGRAIGDRWGIASCLMNLGVVADYQDDYATAARRYGEGLAISRSIGNRWGVAAALSNLGNASAQLGNDAVAWQYFRDSLSGALGLGAPVIVLYCIVGIAGLQAKAGAHLRAAELLGLALGHPSSIGDLARGAEPTLALLRAALTADELDAALARGKTLDLKQVTEEILAGLQ